MATSLNKRYGYRKAPVRKKLINYDDRLIPDELKFGDLFLSENDINFATSFSGSNGYGNFNTTSNGNSTKVPLFQPLGIIIDNNEMETEVDQYSLEKQNYKKMKQTALELFYTISRPREELLYCNFFTESERYRNEGLGTLMKLFRYINHKHSTFNLEDYRNRLSLSDNEKMGDDIASILRLFWRKTEVPKLPKKSVDLVIINKAAFCDGTRVDSCDQLVGKKRPCTTHYNVRFDDIRDYHDQIDERLQETNVTRERPKAVPTRRRPQVQTQKGIPGRMDPSNPQYDRRRIMYERNERIRKILPMHYPALGNMTPFGPPVERSLLRKYMLEDKRIFVNAVDKYLTAKTAIKFSIMGTYFRSFKINKKQKKAFACFFNWENAASFYRTFGRLGVKTTNKAQLNKQFVSCFFRKSLIYRTIRNQKMPYFRPAFEKELLKFFFTQGMAKFNYFMHVLEMKFDDDVKTAQVADLQNPVFKRLIARCDPHFWCTVFVKHCDESELNMIVKDRGDKALDLYACLDERNEKAMSDDVEILETSSYNDDAFECRAPREKLISDYATRFKNKETTVVKTHWRPVRQTTSILDDEASSPGAGPSSNETAREMPLMDRQTDDSQMDLDPPTPLGERPELDEEDIPFNPAPHLGWGRLPFKNENGKRFDNLPGRALVMRIGLNTGPFLDPLYENGERCVTFGLPETGEPNGNVSRKRNGNMAETHDGPPKVSKTEDVGFFGVFRGYFASIGNYIFPAKKVVEKRVFGKKQSLTLTPGFSRVFKDYPLKLPQSEQKVSCAIIGQIKKKLVQYLISNKKCFRRQPPGYLYNLIEPFVTTNLDYFDMPKRVNLAPNYNNMVLKDAVVTFVDLLSMDDLLLLPLQLQRKCKRKRNVATRFFKPNRDDMTMKRFLGVAIADRMPNFMKFHINLSTMNMPPYGCQLRTGIDVDVLPHTVTTPAGGRPLILQIPMSGVVNNVTNKQIAFNAYRELLPMLPLNHPIHATMLRNKQISYQDIRRYNAPTFSPVTARPNQPGMGVQYVHHRPIYMRPIGYRKTKPVQKPLPVVVKKKKKEVDPIKMFSPQSAAFFDILEDIYFTLPDDFVPVVEKYPNKKKNFYIEELTRQFAKRLPYKMTKKAPVLKPVAPKKPIFSVPKSAKIRYRSRLMSKTNMSVLKLRKRSIQKAKKRFKERQQICLLLRSYTISKADLLAILRQYEMKCQITIYNLGHHPLKKTPYYRMRNLLSKLRCFTPRKKIRGLENQVPDIRKRLSKTSLKRSKSVEHLPKTTPARKRRASVSELDSLELKDKHGTKKIRRKRRRRMTRKRRSPQSATFANIFGDNSCHQGPTTQRTWKPRRRKEVKRIGNRWRISNYLDDYWKCIRLAPKLIHSTPIVFDT